MTRPTRCPCGTGETYAECCGPLHDSSRPAPTAEALMRSRFSAFAVGDEAYLRASWHPRTRPADVGVDPSLRWTRLEIVDVIGGGQFEDHGIVEFRAHYRDSDGNGSLAERSTFLREDGRWYYLTGEAPRPGRAAPPRSGSARR